MKLTRIETINQVYLIGSIIDLKSNCLCIMSPAIINVYEDFNYDLIPLDGSVLQLDPNLVKSVKEILDKSPMFEKYMYVMSKKGQ